MVADFNQNSIFAHPKKTQASKEISPLNEFKNPSKQLPKGNLAFDILSLNVLCKFPKIICQFHLHPRNENAIHFFRQFNAATARFLRPHLEGNNYVGVMLLIKPLYSLRMHCIHGRTLTRGIRFQEYKSLDRARFETLQKCDNSNQIPKEN